MVKRLQPGIGDLVIIQDDWLDIDITAIVVTLYESPKGWICVQDINDLSAFDVETRKVIPITGG